MHLDSFFFSSVKLSKIKSENLAFTMDEKDYLSINYLINLLVYIYILWWMKISKEILMFWNNTHKLYLELSKGIEEVTSVKVSTYFQKLLF